MFSRKPTFAIFISSILHPKLRCWLELNILINMTNISFDKLNSKIKQFLFIYVLITKKTIRSISISMKTKVVNPHLRLPRSYNTANISTSRISSIYSIYVNVSWSFRVNNPLENMDRLIRICVKQWKPFRNNRHSPCLHPYCACQKLWRGSGNELILFSYLKPNTYVFWMK